MGKVIVIKGADFSGVAVERIEYEDSARTEILTVTQNNRYYNNPSGSAPSEQRFNGYGCNMVDVSAYVGYRLVVSAAAGSGATTSLFRIDDVSNNTLYRTEGANETVLREEVTIPAGAKYLYVNNYFSWDASPFVYVYAE